MSPLLADIAAVAERLGQQRAVDPVDLLRGRADALAQRAAGLKKLADAWQPLYQSLSPDQKQPMQVLAVRVLRLTERCRGYPPDGDVRRGGRRGLKPGSAPSGVRQEKSPCAGLEQRRRAVTARA